MKILLLSPYPKLLAPWLGWVDVVTQDTPLPLEPADFTIAFGYRHILRAPDLSRPIINVHISLLPWNRGADPNFWSWVDGTPKGVSIHYMDEGIDTGPIIAQREVKFNPGVLTLRSSYDRLRHHAVSLFAETWPSIRAGKAVGTPQRGVGSYHRSRDKDALWPLLSAGYDTRVQEVAALRSRLPHP